MGIVKHARRGGATGERKPNRYKQYNNDIILFGTMYNIREVIFFHYRETAINV